MEIFLSVLAILVFAYYVLYRESSSLLFKKDTVAVEADGVKVYVREARRFPAVACDGCKKPGIDYRVTRFEDCVRNGWPASSYKFQNLCQPCLIVAAKQSA